MFDLPLVVVAVFFFVAAALLFYDGILSWMDAQDLYLGHGEGCECECYSDEEKKE